MSRPILRRAVAAVSSFAVAAAVALILPMPAEAITAARAYGGSAYGSSAKFGNIINSGRTANQPFCTTASNVSRSNNTAAVNLKGLGTIGAQVTKVQSVKKGTTQQSITTSTTAGTTLLNGVIGLTAIKSTAIVTLDSSGYKESGKTEILGLKIGGVAVNLPVSPAPNTKVNVPLLGVTLILNQQGTLNQFGLHSQGVNGLRLILGQNNATGLPAGELVLSYSLASLHSPQFRRAYGVAYVTKVDVGGVVQSGATAAVNLPCGGSSGVTRTNNVAGLNLPGVLQVGAATTTAKSVDSSTSTNATTTAQLGQINLLNGLVTADAIKAVSSTTKKGSTYSRSSAGSKIVGLKINGKAVDVLNVGPNTTIDIGVGKLYLRRSVWSATGMDVIALQIVLAEGVNEAPAGAKITVGFAQSGVV